MLIYLRMHGIFPFSAAFAAFFLVASLGFAGDRTIVSADKAFAMARDGQVTIVDVRSPTEWRQTGIPQGALTVTIHNPDGEQGFVAAMTEILGGDKNRPIALICASGNRSARAQQWLEAAGFSSVSNISEGMMGRGDAPGWLTRDLPTEKCKSC